MPTEEIVRLLKVLSLSQNKTVPAKGHRGSVSLKSHLLVIDETSVLLSTPEGYANKCCLHDSQLNNKYLQGFVQRHSTQSQQQTKNIRFYLRDVNLMSGSKTLIDFICKQNAKMSRNNLCYLRNLFDSVKWFSQL